LERLELGLEGLAVSPEDLSPMAASLFPGDFMSFW
jgi:hypothetical protein